MTLTKVKSKARGPSKGTNKSRYYVSIQLISDVPNPSKIVAHRDTTLHYYNTYVLISS